MANERKYTGFPSDEYFVLFGARERLGNQWRSPIPISEIIDTGKEVSPISNFLKSIEPRSDYVTAALSRIVDAEAGLTPSRPAACALFILKFISQDFERRA